MNLLLTLVLSATGALAQVNAIPQCAQACFSHAVDFAGCVNVNGAMDPTCACTSYNIKNNLGGHDTGILYAQSLCRTDADCTTRDLSALSKALNNICYNEDQSPKYNCGVIPGSPVPPTISVKPTGTKTITVSLNPTSTDTLTLDEYPQYTTTMTTIPVYTTAVTTEISEGTTKTVTTSKRLYLAVCPTRVVVGEHPAQSVALTSRGNIFLSTYNPNDLYAKITAAAASASSVAATHITSSSGVIQTGATTTGGAQEGNSTATGSSASVSATKNAGAQGVAGTNTRLGALGAALVGALAIIV